MKPLIIALVVMLAANPASAAISGRITAVHDGDTVTLLTDEKQQIKVRLAEIDAPELKQPYGQKSKQGLSALCFDKPASIEPVTKDRYGRTVARVTCAGVPANKEMVRAGAAWVYRKYSDSPELLKLEEEARAAHRGLWGLQPDQITPPWEWRKSKRTPE